GNFFIHYVWSPFRAGYDALYMGCRDVAGAEAAVASLATLTPPAPAPVVKPEGKPVVLRSAAPTTLEDVSGAMGSTPIIKAEFSPSGNRLFVITASYGDWLFVLDPDGKILEQRMPPNSKWFPYWFVWGRWMNPVSDTLLRLFLFDGEYQYDLTRGYLSKSARMSMLEDKKAGRFYRGDGERVYALDAQGRLVWCYNDSISSGDLSVVRSLTPRVLNGNGRVLLVSATAGKEKESGAVLGLDCATGKILWQRGGVVLNSGKVITLDDRFIVIADDGAVTEIIAADGRAGNAMSALTGSPDFVLQVPGRDTLLIAENNHFDRQSPSSRVYLRSLKNGSEQDLNVPGRVTSIVFVPDNQSFVVVTSARRALRFACDGALIWDVKTPSNGSILASPDGKTLALSGSDGMVHLFHTADGKLKRSVDLNFGNKITAEKFIKQERMSDLPTETGRELPSLPLEPSYLKSIVPPNVTFGPNLAPPERMRELLKPADPVASEGEKPGYLGKLTEAIKLPPFKVEAGTTYLVELVNVVGVATNTDSMLRLEITVTGNAKSKNLPCTARLPVDSILARRRFAFRADNNDEVTLTMRPIMPVGRRSFDKVAISEIPVVIGDVVVSAMKFPGPNVLLDGGPGSRSKPAGSFACTLYPAKSGMTGVTYPKINCQTFALQLVNGVIANRPTAWGKINGSVADGGTVVASADAVTRFSTPTALSAILVYEDMTGPLIEGNVRERTAIRYAVEVHNVAGNWERIGVLTDNRQLVNVFPCPAYKIDGIRYAWAGRNADEQKMTDGFVRTAQIEAYAADDARTIGDMLNITKEPDGMNIDP
ncbi:MAG: PQQ-binding-like beta-propeller repeat protein, partial [bacterium]